MQIRSFVLAALLCSPVCISYGEDFVFRPPLTPVLSDQIQVCKHLVLAKWIANEKTADPAIDSSRFEVLEIGFSHGERFRPGQIIEVRGRVVGTSNTNYALMGRDDHTEGWYSPLQVSSDAWGYITRMPLPTTALEANAKRLCWFFAYLEHPDPLISADVFAEISSTPHPIFTSVRDKFPREKIMKALAAPDTVATRIPFYGLMAGYCGKPEDAETLEKKILVSDTGHQHDMIAGLMLGYLLIRGEEGLQVLEASKMRETAETSRQRENVSPTFVETYATTHVLRYMWDHESNRISKERLNQSMRVLLKHPKFTDVAIAQLQKWKDWSIQDRLMAIYDDEVFTNDVIRRSIVLYLYSCSREINAPEPERATTSRAEYAAQAAANLKILKEQDPDTFDAVTQILIQAQPLPSHGSRPAPILANAEAIERIAKASSRGLSCGVGVLQFLDHTGRHRRIFTGLEAIHVFGEGVDAKVLSLFLEARAKANLQNAGPMHGERRFLLATILQIVELSEDASFIDLLIPLLDDPVPEIRDSVQSALFSIANRNASRRMQILELLNQSGWSRVEH